MTASTNFQSDNENGFERIELLASKTSRFRLGDKVPEKVAIDDWLNEAPKESRSALDVILSTWADAKCANDGTKLVEIEGASLLLHPSLVAGLSDSHAIALGLPRATALTLELNGRGVFPREDFEVEKIWRRPGNLATRVTISGARLKRGRQDSRIPEPVYSALKAADALNAAQSRDEKQMALAELRMALDLEPDQKDVRPDLFLSRLRVKYAAGFSLDLTSSAEGFDFEPVLFAPAYVSAELEDEAIDQDADSLLSPIQGKDFQAQFRASEGDRKAYVLGDGSLVFLDPLLGSALQIVRLAQAGDSDERKRFARNPRKVISEALEADLDTPEQVADIFVETQQYSDRVAGIDVWRQPVLPWIKPTPNTWLPESFGFRVGEGANAVSVELKPEDVQEAVDQVRAAIDSEAETAMVNGVEVPASQQALEALEDLLVIAQEVDAASQDINNEATNKLPPSLRDRYFLQISDNLEEINYAPLAESGEQASYFDDPIWPAGMRSTPKSYQTTGFGWLVNCHRAGMPGCLLADDMGLGKTFQALSFLVWLREAAGVTKPFLVVAPAGLLANWEAEIRLHLKDTALGSIFRAFGSHLKAIRRTNAPDIKTANAGLNHSAWNDAGVVLTTYETMRDYHMSFAREKFGCIIYDEIQKLKNPASQATRAAKSLNAEFQLAMTGTPVENRLQDLWSISDVVHPGLLGSSKEFEKTYPANDVDKLSGLNQLLAEPQGSKPPFMLRRMKDQSLDGLPEKTVEKVEYDMPPEQAREYLKVVNRALAADADEGPGRMLKILHRLRGVSLHPFDPVQATDDGTYFEKSARTKALVERLDTVQKMGEKALIFCESLAMQSVLAGYLERRYDLPSRVERIHGGITGDQRQKIVDEFQAAPVGFRVLVISPKAGGVGLTLTAANHVFHLSRWWNPAVEDQATDRVYRLGQTRKVHVHILQAVHPDAAIRDNSFDKKLDQLIERKRGLSSGLLMPGEQKGDVANLFGSVIFEMSAEPSLAEPPLSSEQSRPHAPAESLPGGAEDKRPILSLPKGSVEERLTDFPRRVIYRPTLARDLAIFTEPVRGRGIRTLRIRDPYGAAGSDNRSALIEFVELLSESARGVGEVSFTTLDADSVNSYSPENDHQQWDDLFRKWSKSFPDRSKPTFIRLSKRQVRGFHDREIIAELEDGSSIIWDLGNGVESIFNRQRECRVVLTID